MHSLLVTIIAWVYETITGEEVTHEVVLAVGLLFFWTVGLLVYYHGKN
jgi:hypothetical protein